MMAGQRCIAVLGTLTRDTTVYADGSRSENLGGTHYTLLALAHLLRGSVRVLPVANVGADAFADIHAALDLPGIDRTALRRVDEPNNHVYLTYKSATERDEVLVGLVPPVTVEDCAPLRDVDWILVNLTSGRDVTLDAMEFLRRESRCAVQLDVHSLTLDFDPDGRRFLRKPAAWERWVACADWVQMNEAEANLLGDRRPLPDFARDILKLGPQGVMITLGSAGVLGAWSDDSDVRFLSLPAARRPEPAYTTGCGDVFGAGFAYAALLGAGFSEALHFATAAAGAKACHEPYGELRRLRADVAEELRRFVPAGAVAPGPARGG